MNSLFTHYIDSSKPFRATEGHAKLSGIGLLRSDGGSCDKCGYSRNLQNKKKGDGLIWKCSKCKSNEKSMHHFSIFHNSKCSLHVLLLTLYDLNTKTLSKTIIDLLDVNVKTVTD